MESHFTVFDYIFSAISTFVIVAGGTLSVAGWAAGHLNKEGVIGASVMGAVAAAKDFRSLRRLPPVKNGSDSNPPFVKP